MHCVSFTIGTALCIDVTLHTVVKDVYAMAHQITILF